MLNYKVSATPVIVVLWLGAILLFGLAIGGCASLADLHEFEARARQNLEDFQSGTITKAEYLERDLEFKEELTDSTEARLADWSESMQNGPITGNPMVDLVIGSIPAVLGGGYLLNRSRDKKYKNGAAPLG